jgi:hypothetical protein
VKKETKIARIIDLKLDCMGAVRYNIQQVAMRGVPDRLGCIRGKFFALEIKTSKENADKKTGTTALQRYNVDKINRAGGFARFIYPENMEDVLRDLNEWCK